MDGNPGEVSLLGPAPAPIAKVRGQYRFHLLLLSQKTRADQASCR